MRVYNEQFETYRTLLRLLVRVFRCLIVSFGRPATLLKSVHSFVQRTNPYAKENSKHINILFCCLI